MYLGKNDDTDELINFSFTVILVITKCSTCTKNIFQQILALPSHLLTSFFVSL